MVSAEDQLRAIAASPNDWDIPQLENLKAGASALVDMAHNMMPAGWSGVAADAANVAFDNMAVNFAQIEKAVDDLLASLVRANAARTEAIAALGGLSSSAVDPQIAATARVASVVLFRGTTIPAEGAISFIENILGNQREEEAQTAINTLDIKLEAERETILKTTERIAEYEPVLGGGDGPSITPPPVYVPRPPITPPTSMPPRPTPSITTVGSTPTGPTGIGLYQPPVSIEPQFPEGYPPPIDRPSVDAPIIGTVPTSPGPGTLVPAPAHFPGGNSDFGNGGSGGTGGHGGGGGNGANGMGVGLIGGGGAAAAAAAAAAKARLGGGAGGLGSAGSAGGAGGANGRLGAGGLGGAGGVGAGGTGAGGPGAGGAGGTGAAGGAGRLGGGGLLGSQGGGAAGGGNTTVATTNSGGAGGRGAGGMMGGGGAGNEDRERRGGLGGMMAPKLDDESDAAPRSAGASAGGRDQQPTD